MANSEKLALVAKQVANCQRCARLVGWRQQVAINKRAAFADWDYWARGVPGFGDPHARIVVVGLAPAAHGANRTGRMFTGDRSGEWLYRALHRAGLGNQPESQHVDDGLLLNNVFVTAPVKCAPPDNRPSVGERDNCNEYLVRELEVLQPAVLVALGSFGFQRIGSPLRHSTPAKIWSRGRSRNKAAELSYSVAITSASKILSPNG